MRTDDIEITNEQGWVEIPLLLGGTFVQIAQIRHTKPINVRVGKDSESIGILLRSGDMFKASESIFVKNNYSHKAIITVIRDGA